MNTQAYYQAALTGLHFVQARQPTGPRVAPEADARWSRFAGELTTADRVDPLLREAARAVVEGAGWSECRRASMWRSSRRELQWSRENLGPGADFSPEATACHKETA